MSLSRIFVALGSSLEDGLSRVEQTVQALDQQQKVRVVGRSAWYETAPVGPTTGAFVNGVLELATSLGPVELLDLLQRLEREAGRTPGVRWGARELDLDLLAHGETLHLDDRLQLPHPEAWYRRFVLDPWEELAPDWNVPRWKLTVGDLRRRLLIRPLPLQLEVNDLQFSRELADLLTMQFGEMLLLTLAGPPDETPQSVLRDPLTESRVRLGIGPFPGGTAADPREFQIDLSALAERLGVSIIDAALYILTAVLDEPQRLEPASPV